VRVGVEHPHGSDTQHEVRKLLIPLLKG